MRRSIFILASLVLFVSFSISDIVFGAEHVSPETKLATRREMFVVKQGVSSDGSIFILSSSHNGLNSLHQKVQNRSQNLRVWQERSPDGSSTLFFVEQFRPRQLFEVRMTSRVSPETLRLAWNSPTSFMFCGTESDGQQKRFDIDVHALTLQKSSAEPARCPTESNGSLSSDE